MRQLLGDVAANTMNCMTKLSGWGCRVMALFRLLTRRIALAREAGAKIFDLLSANVCPRDIINSDSLENAFSVDMALGGSTNSVLHLMAIAHEAGVEFPLDRINAISEKTPCLCKLRPAGTYHIEDLDRAGGISAVMKELKSLLKLNSKTVSGLTIGQIIDKASVRDADVIRSEKTAYSDKGGLAILFGNLAPEGGVVKRSAVAPEMMVHQGPARVFDSEDDATKAIMEIKSAQVMSWLYDMKAPRAAVCRKCLRRPH